MEEDGSVDVDKAIEMLPKDMPNYEKIVEAVKVCATESK